MVRVGYNSLDLHGDHPNVHGTLISFSDRWQRFLQSQNMDHLKAWFMILVEGKHGFGLADYIVHMLGVWYTGWCTGVTLFCFDREFMVNFSTAQYMLLVCLFAHNAMGVVHHTAQVAVLLFPLMKMDHFDEEMQETGTTDVYASMLSYAQTQKKGMLWSYWYLTALRYVAVIVLVFGCFFLGEKHNIYTVTVFSKIVDVMLILAIVALIVSIVSAPKNNEWRALVYANAFVFLALGLMVLGHILWPGKASCMQIFSCTMSATPFIAAVFSVCIIAFFFSGLSFTIIDLLIYMVFSDIVSLYVM